MAELLSLRGTETPPQCPAWMLSPPKLIQPREERGAPSPPIKPHITPTRTPSSPPLAPRTALTLQCHGSVAQAMWGHQDGDTEMGDGEIMGIAG